MAQPNFSSAFTKTYHHAPYAEILPTQPNLSAANKTVLITGGASGIGFAIAEAFATAAASHIILITRREEALKVAKEKLSSQYPEVQVHTYAASVSDGPRIKEVFADIQTAVGDIDILVSCAGLSNRATAALELPFSEIWDCFETNVQGGLNVVKEFLKTNLENNKKKVIIDISSAAAHVALPKQGPYCASKAAFTTMLRHIYNENKASGLFVYSVHPGAIFTDQARSFGYSEGDLNWDDAKLPADFSVWLASEEAEFLSGRFVWANWDVKEMKARKAEFEKSPELLTLGLVVDSELFPVV